MFALDPLIAATITTGLALLFINAAIHKVRDVARFRDTLARYELLPPLLAPLAALMIIMAEIVVAIAALVPAWRATAASCAAALLLLYAGAIAINLRRGRVSMDCGCGGIGERQTLQWWMVRRNLLLAVVALVATLPVSARELGWSDLFVISCATVSAAGLYLAHATLAVARDRVGR
jgi:hypothetical protein